MLVNAPNIISFFIGSDTIGGICDGGLGGAETQLPQQMLGARLVKPAGNLRIGREVAQRAAGLTDQIPQAAPLRGFVEVGNDDVVIRFRYAVWQVIMA